MVTFSTLRSSGQPPLRSRTAPLGLSSLSPIEDEKVRSANLVLEILAWCAEQALQCAYQAVGLMLIFLRTLEVPPKGPASIWMLRELQVLDGCCDARRAAGYLCQLPGADYKRPLGFFTTSLHLRSRPFPWLASLGKPNMENYNITALYLFPVTAAATIHR